MYIIYNFSYPPHEAKIELAKALVTEFPLLKNKESPLGYVSFLSL